MPSLPRQEGVRSPVRGLLGETCSAAMRPVRCAFALDRSSLAHPRPDRSGHRMHPLTPLDSAQLPHPLAVPAVHRTWTSSLSCHQPTVTTAVLGTAVSRLSACLALAPSVRLTPIRFAARLYPHSTLSNAKSAKFKARSNRPKAAGSIVIRLAANRNMEWAFRRRHLDRSQ